MDLEAEILKKIVPSPERTDELRRIADRFESVVKEYAKSHGIDAEVRFAGSFSKNTFLDDPDLDTFMLFPPETDPEDLKRIGLKAGEDILRGTRMFSDHPYTRGTFEGVSVDLVPCYGIDSAENLKSAVDRTPFHTEFVKSRLSPEGCDQVRLLKKFMKGIGTYGAEQDSRGFSGYLCELLVIKFGSFRGTLEASAGWRGRTVIEIEGRGPAMSAPLVVYDPVDTGRNVASAVHPDTLSLFVAAAKDYLKSPSPEFFFPEKREPHSRETLWSKAASRGTRLVSVSFARPAEAVEDSLQSQLWKTRYALAKQLENHGFAVIRAVHSMSETEMKTVFELETDTLPGVRRHAGPPTWVRDGPFLDKWRGNPDGEPFVEDGTWVVVSRRRYVRAADMIRGEMARSGIGKDFLAAETRIWDHGETLENEDPELLTELLDPVLPWRRRALFGKSVSPETRSR